MDQPTFDVQVSQLRHAVREGIAEFVARPSLYNEVRVHETHYGMVLELPGVDVVISVELDMGTIKIKVRETDLRGSVLQRYELDMVPYQVLVDLIAAIVDST